MPAEAMTLQEFQEQASRLHKRYPWIYPGRKQVELAWYVHGLPLEWFKTRVDYVIRSSNGHYDWKQAAESAKRWRLESAPYHRAMLDNQKILQEGLKMTITGFHDRQLIVTDEGLGDFTIDGRTPTDEMSAWDLVEQKRAENGEADSE